MRDTLDSLVSKLKKDTYLCKQYKRYNNDVQQMVNNIYKATYRIGLYDSQIIYILEEALKPFKKKPIITNKNTSNF